MGNQVGTIRGLSGLMKTAHALCRIEATFHPLLVTVLTGPELAALSALVLACKAFSEEVNATRGQGH